MFPGPDSDATNEYVLFTSRLRLAPPIHDDVEPLFALIDEHDRGEITQNLLWDGPESPIDIEQWVAGKETETYGSGGFAWIIHLNGSVAGTITLRPNHFGGRALVGYWLGIDFWRQGIMAEALSAVLDLAFSTLDIGKVEGEVFTHNTASARLLESLGFTREARFRRAVFKAGRWIDEEVYGILAEEWPQG